MKPQYILEAEKYYSEDCRMKEMEDDWKKFKRLAKLKGEFSEESEKEAEIL